MRKHGSHPGGWRVVSSPTWADLYAAVSTVDGPYVVGEGGQLLGTKNDQWCLLDEGPAFGNRGIAGVDTTDGGERIWVTGTGGAITCYDVANRDARDHTLPEGTERATAFTVAGEGGSERGLVATADGRVIPFLVDGTSLRWRDPHKPAGGTPIEALAAPPDGHGIAIDSHGHAHRTVSGGWAPYGTVDTDRSVRALYAFEHETYALFDGRAYRHGEESGWQQLDIGGKPAFRAAAYREQDEQRHVLLVALGGTCYEKIGDGPWQPGSLPGEDIVGATMGDTDVAAGANGLIVERPERETEEAKATSEPSEGSGTASKKSTTPEQAGSEQQSAPKQPGSGQQSAPKQAGSNQQSASEESGGEQKSSSDQSGSSQQPSSAQSGEEQQSAGENESTGQQTAADQSGGGRQSSPDHSSDGGQSNTDEQAGGQQSGNEADTDEGASGSGY